MGFFVVFSVPSSQVCNIPAFLHLHAAATGISIVTLAHPIVVTAVTQVADFAFCGQVEGSPLLETTYIALQVVLAAILSLLVAIKFTRGSFKMYKLTKRWQSGRYMKLFVREGLLYFLGYVYISFLLFQPVTRRLDSCSIPFDTASSFSRS